MTSDGIKSNRILLVMVNKQLRHVYRRPTHSIHYCYNFMNGEICGKIKSDKNFYLVGKTNHSAELTSSVLYMPIPQPPPGNL